MQSYALLILSTLKILNYTLGTQVAYYHGKLYGALAYKDKTSFNKFHKHDEFLKVLTKEFRHAGRKVLFINIIR